jgi:hypothetical protein
LKRHWKSSPRKAADDNVKAFVWSQVGVKIKVLGTRILKSQTRESLAQPPGKIGIQLDPEIL